jgi:flagellar basal-body rod protein FlgB
MKLFDNTFVALERKLDLYTKRHLLLSGNVANSETPNYKARELDFAGELEKVLRSDSDSIMKTNPKHIGLTNANGPHIVFDNTGAVGSDGNNVDLDIMMGKISRNAHEYNNAAMLMTMQLRILRKTTSGGQGGM